MKQIQRLFILSTIGILLVFDLYAQSPDTLRMLTTGWTKMYGGKRGDAGYSIQQTSDWGFIITGVTNSFGSGFCDVYLIKTDSKGDTLWTRRYGGTKSDFGFSVKETSDGGYVVAGYTWSFGAGAQDVYLIKTDINGDIQWTRTYGGKNYDRGQSVQQTSDGGYIVAGYTWSFGSGRQDVYLIRTNTEGDTIWTKTYGGMLDDAGYSVLETPEEGFIITGVTNSFGSGAQDVYLIKTDENGDVIWTKSYGGIGDDFGRSVQHTRDGGYIIGGYSNSFGSGAQDVYLIKTDENGDTVWTKTIGGKKIDGCGSIQESSDGGYIIVGWTRSFGAGDYDVYLIKTDINGNVQWTRMFGGPEWDKGNSVQQTNDGGFIITGHTISFGSEKADVFLIKVVP